MDAHAELQELLKKFFKLLKLINEILSVFRHCLLFFENTKPLSEYDATGSAKPEVVIRQLGYRFCVAVQQHSRVNLNVDAGG